jgi:hypothetical protein
MGLEPDERLYAIALGKTWNDLIAVLPDALHQIVGHPDVKRAVRFVCKDVNKESHTWGRKRIDGGCNRPFVRKIRSFPREHCRAPSCPRTPACAEVSGLCRRAGAPNLRSFPRKRESTLRLQLVALDPRLRGDERVCARGADVNRRPTTARTVLARQFRRPRSAHVARRRRPAATRSSAAGRQPARWRQGRRRSSLRQ